MRTILKRTVPIALLLAMFTMSCSSAASGNQSNTTTNVSNSAANTGAGQGTGSGAAAENAALAAAPEALIADLYKQHDAKKGPFFQDKDRALVDKYFVKSLADLIWKDSTRANKNNEVGAIDADPLYNGQDFEIKNFKVGKGTVAGDKATVIVTFDNFGKKQSVKFLLLQEKSVWKIDDIDYGEALTLRKWVSDAYSGKAEEAPLGEFEGKYQVGTAICTVKPVKMAFEVKWEKGSGVEMFFSQGEANDKFIFSSDPDKGKANSFSFDDENYNTGIFYRADGKELPIKRIK